jgi:quercetin dioxygenase-like cupin family protein
MILRVLFSSAALTLSLAYGSLLKAEDAYNRIVSSKTILKTEQDSAGQPIHYPEGAAEITGLLVEVPAGQSTGWHLHPSPCVAYVLEGEVTVEIENGIQHTYKAGDSFAEVQKLKHRGHNPGKSPVRILLFAIGEKGAPVSQAAKP